MSTNATPLTSPVNEQVAQTVTVANTPEEIRQQVVRDQQGRFTTPEVTPPPVEVAPTVTPSQPFPDSTPPEPPPYTLSDLGNGRSKVVYRTGETFEGTQQEILGSIATAHVQTKQWAQQQRQPEPPVIQAPPPPDADKGMQDFVLDLVAKGLGYDSADRLKQAQAGMYQTTQHMEGQSLAVDFARANPDWVETPQNTQALLNVLDQSGVPKEAINVRTLTMAHKYALATKLYQPAAPAQATTVVPQPPPMLPGASPQGHGTQEVNINMTADQIRAAIDAAKAAGRI